MAASVAFSALVSGTIVALVTGSLSDRLAQSQEDGRLRDAALTLAYELQTKHADPASVTIDENEELSHTGVTVAIYDDARYVAGDRRIPYVEAAQCQDRGANRVCSVRAGPWVVSAARDRRLTRTHFETTARFAIAAVILTSLLSSVIALSLVRRAVQPLARLADAVQRVPDDAPETARLGVQEGVAEVDALREALQSAFDRLGRALAQSRSFAANAAHQLRTPLATIIGELELALERPNVEARDEIARAHQVAARLSTLLDRLLILARPDETLNTTAELSLLDAVEDAVATIPEPARQRIQYAGTSVQIRADPALIISAIMSALENALKFSNGEVRVLAETRGTLAVVAIEDDGPGLAPGESDLVFAPFYRGREGRSGRTTGHGIGLAVIARVAALHGGSARFVERSAGARLEMTFTRAGG